MVIMGRVYLSSIYFDDFEFFIVDVIMEFIIQKEYIKEY